MKKFETIQQILDYAIEREQETHGFYDELAETIENTNMKSGID